MNKLIKLIKDKIHFHSFDKPIKSAYVSFNTRDIIYECKCSKKKIIRVNLPFSIPFPIETTPFITTEDLKQLL